MIDNRHARMRHDDPIQDDKIIIKHVLYLEYQILEGCIHSLNFPNDYRYERIKYDVPIEDCKMTIRHVLYLEQKILEGYIRSLYFPTSIGV